MMDNVLIGLHNIQLVARSNKLLVSIVKTLNVNSYNRIIVQFLPK